MRAGNCALQQALTAESSAVVKQAVLLAKRRGHAQVTPLHVASTMLSSPNGLFRAACLESHSHPLQCKALELCFNVALNRLPASSSNPMLVGPHHHHHHHQGPSISNALVAAFKRAQAHQRRGSIENQSQQQTLLAVKIELEQLVISILDDPSVSRVMREAGFSSPQVKSNVEKTVSLELCSPNNNKSKESNNPSLLTLKPSSPKSQNEDVNIIIENLLLNKKRKSIVLVGECVSSLETAIKGLMDKVDKGEIPDDLKEIKFVTIPPLYSFCNLRREEVEQKIGELTCLVKSLLGKGVVLYLGDLKWISDYRVSLEQERSYYCSVEHMIMEIGRLVWGIGEIERFWLMGVANFQSYMKCRNGYHSLETVWGLYPVTIPANTLGFSLVSESDEQIEAKQRRKPENPPLQLWLTNGDQVELSCCADCSAKFDAEVRNLQTSFCNSTNESTLSNLPSWLKDESRRLGKMNQTCDAINELRNKWNSFCNSAHKHLISPLDKTLTFSSSTSCFPFDQQKLDSTRTHFPSLPDQTLKLDVTRWTSNVATHMHENENSKNRFSSNSASSSEIMEIEYTQKFKEFNAENLNIICNALEKNVPSHKEIVPEIAGTILQCRSGMVRRKNQVIGNNNNVIINDVKNETWLLFLGPDGAQQAKEKICRELAKVVFGSYSNFVSIGLSGYVSLSTTSDEECCRNNRGRDHEQNIERFAREVCENPHRVFLLDDFEHADYRSLMGIKRAIERGKMIRSESGEEFGFSDAIVVLSCEKFKSRSSRACSPRGKTGNEDVGGGDEESTTSGGGSLDLNVSFDGDHCVEDQIVDDDHLGIVDYVDRRVVFKINDM